MAVGFIFISDLMFGGNGWRPQKSSRGSNTVAGGRLCEVERAVKNYILAPRDVRRPLSSRVGGSKILHCRHGRGPPSSHNFD